MPLENLAIIVGIGVGAVMVFVVLAVFVKQQELGASGLALAVLGVVLMGMGVWGNIRVSAAGVELDVVRQELQRTAEAAATVAAAADSIADVVETQQRSLRELTDELELRRVIPQLQIDRIRRHFVPLNLDRGHLDSARIALDSAAIRLDPRRLERPVP